MWLHQPSKPPPFWGRPGRLAGAAAARLEGSKAAGGLRVGQEREADRAATGGWGQGGPSWLANHRKRGFNGIYS